LHRHAKLPRRLAKGPRKPARKMKGTGETAQVGDLLDGVVASCQHHRGTIQACQLNRFDGRSAGGVFEQTTQVLGRYQCGGGKLWKLDRCGRVGIQKLAQMRERLLHRADIVSAIVAYEQSPIVSPFSSKHDRYIAGFAEFTPKELAGLQLFTGSTTGTPGGPVTPKQANCVTCHTIPSADGQGPDLFTGSVFLNTGTPKNPNNPYYKQTSAVTDPLGYNPLGEAYIDYGLGDFLYPTNESLPSGNTGKRSKGDFLAINGLFKTPTVRNVALRPDPTFVKCYSHNGFFKSLAQVVHFYNTRNLTTVPGEVIDFTKAHPYEHLKGKPLWPEPENPSPATLINPTGAASGPLGNLGLSAEQEADLAAFLQTLSDEPAATPAPAPAPAPPPPAAPPQKSPPPPPPRP
jgi:hypothetical protein